jgi:hypothetical protein
LCFDDPGEVRQGAGLVVHENSRRLPFPSSPTRSHVHASFGEVDRFPSSQRKAPILLS